MASNPTRLQRSIGGLLGAHAGDSLGATFEFQSYAEIKKSYPTGLREIVGGGIFQFPVGAATDDTDMTRGVLLAYYHHLIPKESRQQQLLDDDSQSGSAVIDSHDVVKLAAQYFLNWLNGDWPGRQKGGRPVDIGGATLAGLLKLNGIENLDQAGAGIGQAGNGSLMRCIPTGIFQACRAEMMEQSMRISAITHNDARCTISCAAYNTIVYALLREKSPREAIDEALQAAKSLEESCDQDTGRAVEKAIRLGLTLSTADMATNGPKELQGKAKGYVLESLSIAVAALIDTRPLEDILVDVVRIGGDTDTNAAIAGGLLGVRDGVDAIPLRWRETLQFHQEFERIGSLLVEATKNSYCE
ncbi:ADP-ribosylglycohydrolase [Nannizzia gypsea CBS 118893]|uniref:ADP-ribosylhydrolase ARH3 n=1 Tax=Arthroderma gypseum (strain ATCC MYA-4604 / CBS 118893) TaxID=535722 RepID=E4V4A9_ARTGP|nr:ADP-ribosylglycohydrolase [Nannizzia gypsea CBS 118893]EFR04833.1 ADP-ribosylglycohydrolase [Nannizzia gypsea CBS 118893]